MHYVKCTLIIFAVCVVLWVLCKWLKFSIIPKSFIIPKPNLQTFKLPKVKRSEKGEIIVEDDKSDNLSSFDDSSSEESFDDSSDDDSSDSSEDDSSDNDDFY